MSETHGLMRSDLHVHSRHSGAATVPVLRFLARECYSEPQEVYDAARRRGMDLVTLTDHDSITGALELAGRPDTFVSEEVTCEVPGGRELHLGVFDLTEGQHEALQARRRDLEALFAYAAEQRLPLCVNHPFSALTGRRDDGDLPLAFAGATHVEARNGMMSAASNDRARAASRRARLAPCGGSDAHTLASVGRAFTCIRARDRAEFLAGLRAGFTLPAGRAGSYARLTADLLRLTGSAWRDQARRAAAGERAAIAGLAAMAALVPFLPLLPVVTALVYADEQLFAWRHFRRFERDRSRPGPRRPTMLGTPAGAPVR
ncbi:MAG TPA: PHP-associated domain-containing protein [Vicinamibacteria bacterium]|nr:PHP-associated domain-containing protein [Vicinamibacteria bacterium]